MLLYLTPPQDIHQVSFIPCKWGIHCVKLYNSCWKTTNASDSSGSGSLKMSGQLVLVLVMELDMVKELLKEVEKEVVKELGKEVEKEVVGGRHAARPCM